MERRRLFVITLLALTTLGLLACDLGSLTTSKPTVIISSPPSGSQFREGDDINIQSTSTDSTGVTRVELLVDGTLVRTDPAPGAQVSYPLIQTWKAIAGTHTLLVRAYNRSNAASDPAAVVVTVTSGSTTATPTSALTAPTGAAVGTNTPTLTPIGPTSAPGNCTNNSVYVADVTVPDGTIVATGQPFNKIWRLRNNGTCAWGEGYKFVFVGAEAMTAVTSIGVPSTPSGGTADLMIAMVAPPAAGRHIGQWRMKSPSGAFFGDTVYVIINAVVIGAPPPTNTPPAGCPGAPVIESFTVTPTNITPGGSATLNWGAVTNADSATIDQGIGGVATPGSAVVSPATTTTYTLTASGCGGTSTKQVTLIVNPSSVALPPVPSLSSPADGTVFRVSPRVVTFSWDAVSFPGGVIYNVEIQINTGAWIAFATQNGIAGTTYTMPAFTGDNPGRWRVWATSPSAGDGPKSDWRGFSFNTSALQYSANWVNNDTATSGITRINISSTGQQLTVHPYGKCTPTDCDWGAQTQTFSGEPFVITAPGWATNVLTITLNDSAGSTLKVVDVWTSPSSGTATYYFHK